MRTLLHGDAGAAADAGATVWRGIVDASAVPAGLCPPGAMVCAHSRDGRTLSITSLGAGAGQLHGGALSWVASAPCALEDASAQLPSRPQSDFAESAHAEARALTWLTHDAGVPLARATAAPRVATRIAATFPDFADLPPLLAATPAGAIVERRLFYRATHEESEDAAEDELAEGGWHPASALAGGVLTLLGDAADMRLPSLGLGACLSLQSAAALGEALGALPPGAGSAEVAAALRVFEGAQRARARAAAHAALDETRRVQAAEAADAHHVLPTSGAAFQGWLLGNARRGGA